jgi:glucosylceramidase
VRFSTCTRWSSGTNQTAGQWFSIDMSTPQTFSQITIDPAGSSNDWTRAYQVFVSNDAIDWGAPIASGTGTSGILTIMFATQTARFVGIVQTSSGSNWWSIGEINVYGPGAVPTVALSSSGWVASASATNGSDVPSHAIDGQLSTRWSTGAPQTNGQSFQLDMLTSRTIAKLTMNTDGSTSDFPRGYQVFVSDSTSNWGTPVATGAGSSSLTVVQFTPALGRYLKIVETAVASNWWSIAELTVYGVGTFDPVAMALPRAGWVASASVSCSSDTAAKALDDDPSTRFSTCQNQTNGQTFQVDMLTARSFTKITFDAGSSSGDYPRGYQVFVTNDTANWGSPIATGAGAGQVVTVTFPYQTARFIKVVQTGSASTNWWSIHEFNVYGIQPYLLLRDGWVASASLSSSSAVNAIDGRLSTRWSTGAPQVNGQWYQLDMLAPQSFSQITLDSDGASSDYPRSYQVFASNSPTTFGSPIATSVGSASLVSIGFPTQLSRYVRIVQTGSASNWWSISEINVWNNGVAPVEPLVVPSPAGYLRCTLLNGSMITIAGSVSGAVTGAVDVSISPAGAMSLDRLDAHATSLCSGTQCSSVDVQGSPLVLSMGSMTPGDGAINMSVNARFGFTNLTSGPADAALAFAGHLQHRKLVGNATGTLPANAVLFPGASVDLTVICAADRVFDIAGRPPAPSVGRQTSVYR